MTEHPFDTDEHRRAMRERSAMVRLVIDAANAEYPHAGVPAWFVGPLPEFDSVEDDDSSPVRTYWRNFGPVDAPWSVAAVVEDYARDCGLERGAARISVDAPDWIDCDAGTARAIAAALLEAADAVERQ